jgi:hypothetical protein
METNTDSLDFEETFKMRMWREGGTNLHSNEVKDAVY